jgi:thiol-disulfide isomerase/thioredoxin
MRTAPALVLSLAVAGLGSLALESSLAQGESPLLNARPRWTLVTPSAEVRRPAPPWRNRSWLNADHPLTLESLRGRVVLLNFWVFTCYNCTNTVPSLVDFDRKYRDRGLTIIGIHTPEFPPYSGEHDRDNVARALKQYGIEYPVAQDNDDATWNLYGIRFWPSFVLIDRRGEIRYEGYGEFHLDDATYREWDGHIRALLSEGENGKRQGARGNGQQAAGNNEP